MRTLLFAGPCAQGVLDPVIIPCPISRRPFLFYGSSCASLGALDPKVCSSVAPRWLPVGLSLWVATFGTLKKRAVSPYDLNLEPSRTDQGPQHTHHIPTHTHHIPQLMVFWSIFPIHATFGHHFSKKSRSSYIVLEFLGFS